MAKLSLAERILRGNIPRPGNASTLKGQLKTHPEESPMYKTILNAIKKAADFEEYYEQRLPNEIAEFRRCLMDLLPPKYRYGMESSYSR